MIRNNKFGCLDINKCVECRYCCVRTRGRQTVRWCAVLLVVWWWLVTSQQSRCQHHNSNSRDNSNSSRATAETQGSQELAGARVTQ